VIGVELIALERWEKARTDLRPRFTNQTLGTPLPIFRPGHPSEVVKELNAVAWKKFMCASDQPMIQSASSLSVFFKVVPDESKWNEYDNGHAFPGMLFVANALVDGPKAANWRNKAIYDEKRKEDSILHESRRVEADC
jgi:hypothetical protein